MGGAFRTGLRSSGERPSLHSKGGRHRHLSDEVSHPTAPQLAHHPMSFIKDPEADVVFEVAVPNHRPAFRPRPR
jgi:hypothetical protein